MVAAIVFSIDQLRDYAARCGLGLGFVIKEAFIFELMDSMSNDKSFVMKGGTAINKSYLHDHQRFSEDLDYDTDLGKAEVKERVKSLGWKVKKEFFTQNSIGFVMQYKFESITDVVRLDVSFGIDGSSEIRRAASDFIPASKTILAYRFGELNRQKERAFEGRREWKDLYDLYWMSELYKHDFKIKNRQKFREALSEMTVPKVANAYIPLQKRPNWKAVVEALESAAK